MSNLTLSDEIFFRYKAVKSIKERIISASFVLFEGQADN